MLQREALRLYPADNGVSWYNNHISAADKAIEYWTNTETHVQGLIENRLVVRVSQTVPLPQSTINAVLRPKDIAEKKIRIDA